MKNNQKEIKSIRYYLKKYNCKDVFIIENIDNIKVYCKNKDNKDTFIYFNLDYSIKEQITNYLNNRTKENYQYI